MNHMITARETHAASDDIAGILGTADPAAIYQKPLG